jgi:hypothetical protein
MVHETKTRYLIVTHNAVTNEPDAPPVRRRTRRRMDRTRAFLRLSDYAWSAFAMSSAYRRRSRHQRLGIRGVELLAAELFDIPMKSMSACQAEGSLMKRTPSFVRLSAVEAIFA